jgi:hypothetical protein
LLSTGAVEKMTRRWVGAEEFGPTDGYGYGIAVDQDGNDQILLHTGGMVSFMSSIYLNLTQGIGAFASINAQQGYRPTPVTRYATRALGSARLGRAVPPGPIEVPTTLKPADALGYVGYYSLSSGASVRIKVSDRGLQMQVAEEWLPLQRMGDTFLVKDAPMGQFPWRLVRESEKSVIGLSHGPDFYLRAGAKPPIFSEAPGHWKALVGAYVNDDPWVQSSTVYERNGTLFLDGDPLDPLPDGSFYVESEKGAPDRVSFACDVAGKMRILLRNGTPLRRFRRDL